MNKDEQKVIVEKIRAQYLEKESTQLDVLKKLHKKVKRPVNIFSYVVGSIGAIVMGAGMSIIMTDIGDKFKNPMIVGIVIGVIGMIMTIVNYPLYKHILAGRQKKYSAEIIKISDAI